MKRDEVLGMLNEIRKGHRYWTPDRDTAKFMDDIDFDVRIGNAKLDDVSLGRLQEIYRAFKRDTE